MTGHLPPQPWMTAAETTAVLDALCAEGAEARFVGGCVRDALVNRPVNDIDIATDALPETVMQLIQAAGLKAIPTGLKHGTVTAVANHQPFEITTLRRDEETDGRHAVVAFTDDWQEDAARRDFTMNALSLSPDGRLHDYFSGLEDLKAGRVRFVGTARLRLEEDVLRLLRFFRFHARYGSGAADPEALAACRDMAERLPRLSGERVRVELLKLMQAPAPIPALREMVAIGVFHHLFKDHDLPLGDADFTRLDRLITLEAAIGEAPAALRRWAALWTGHLAGDAARAVTRQLRLSNQERDHLQALLDEALPAEATVEAFRSHARLGPDLMRDLALVHMATDGADAETLSHYHGFIDALGAPEFPVQGRHLEPLGIAPGPEMGRLLKPLRQWWVDGGFKADRAECLDQLRRMRETDPGEENKE